MHLKNIIIISFDIGFNFIGISIGNTITKKSHPLKDIKYINNNILYINLKKIIFKWNPKYFIIGLPNKKYNKIYNFCINNFINIIKKFNINYKFINENYSSIINRKKNNSLSANIILQQYLNTL